MKQIIYILLFLLVFAVFFLMFGRIRWLEILYGMLQKGRDGIDEAARRRLLEDRKRLINLQKEHSLWYRLEQELNYSGWKQRFPYLTAELWAAVNVIVGVILFLILAVTFGWRNAVFGAGIAYGAEYLILCFVRQKHFGV